MFFDFEQTCLHKNLDQVIDMVITVLMANKIRENLRDSKTKSDSSLADIELLKKFAKENQQLDLKQATNHQLKVSL